MVRLTDYRVNNLPPLPHRSAELRAKLNKRSICDRLSDMRDPLKLARLCTVLAPVETKRRWSALAPKPPQSFDRATGGGAPVAVVSAAGRRRRALHQDQYSQSQ